MDEAAGRARRTVRIKRLIFRIFRAAAISYVGLCLVLSLSCQNYFVFPGASSQGAKEAIVVPGIGEELVHLKTADGVQVTAVFGKALTANGAVMDDIAHCPTILFFYGNGMCMADVESERHHLRELGANVIVADYTGYGMSGGKPSEQGVYQSAEAAYQYLLSRPDIDQSRIFPMGWSLGAAAAVELAHQHQVAGLITVSAFTSIGEMARRLAPLLPTSLIVSYRFDNEAKLRDIRCPVLIIHGRRDSIVPFAMSEKLKAAAGGPVTYLPIDLADHNDIFFKGGDAVYAAIASFLAGNSATSH
jgi:hypothetical protein